MCWLKNCLKNYQINQKLRSLSNAKRQEILKKSSYLADFFQGEGYHVFRKDDTDYYSGYVTSIGEILPIDSEDWLIKKYWEENGEEQ